MDAQGNITNAGPARLNADAERLLADREPLWSRLPRRIPRGEAAVNPIRTRGHVRGISCAADLEHAAATRTDIAAALRWVRGRLLEGRTVSREPLDEIADALLDLAVRHSDCLAAIAFARGDVATDPACLHAVGTASLCVAAAVELGWSRGDVRDAALVALLADFGMGALSLDPFTIARPLDDFEQARVRTHPALSALLCARIDQIPERVLLAIVQHHERADGRGTPRGLKGPAIHDLSLLTGVCDVLAAVASPRAHRPAMLPHAAVMHVAQLARDGTLDEDMTCAVIRACGAYPPGSHVRLSTGDMGVVVARPERLHGDRPVVRVMPFWGAASFAAIGRPVTVDLSDDCMANVTVVGEVEPEARVSGRSTARGLAC